MQIFYQSRGGDVEAFLMRPRGSGPFPLVVLLHGHSRLREGANRLIAVAEEFSHRLCYASLAISLPGYGMTKVPGHEGDKDLIAEIVLDGLSRTKHLTWVDDRRVTLYGFSRGAAFAAALAPKIPRLRSVLLHSGAYDLDLLYRETKSNWLRLSLNPNGDTQPHLFSVLPEVADWKAPALILHGAKDPLVPASQATLLRNRLQSLGKPHRIAIFPDAGHWLPLNGVRREVSTFLTEHVGSACPG